MLDPVTAIGLASSIIAFVDFGAKLVKGTIEIYDATDGALEENRTREAIAAEMKQLATQLIPPDHSQLAGREKALCMLATECQKLSEKLLELLERVKPRDTASKRQSLWAALKNKFHENELQDLENRLDACRRQLDLHLNFQKMVSVDELSEHVRNNTESLKLLITAVSGLPLTDARDQAPFRRLRDIQQRALHAAINCRILTSLEFEGIHSRQDAVEEAHEKTFRWIFSVTDDDEEELRREAREKFLQWLSSGTGIFHISGKMGSGKSTLMKYLAHHPETKTRLGEWTNGNQLVLASFFFWQPGSDLQKSLGGLFRSLLHDMLNSCPELISYVLPSVWNQAMNASWGAQTKLDIREDDIRDAFNLLVTRKELYANHSFCFFIDGLDEYQTKAGNDYSDMVDTLCGWTTASPSNVKLCVSSREYPIFMSRFSPSQRLSLHTLTRYDIEAYVRDRLRLRLIQDAKSAVLIDSIVEKASGIFFWVSLVVRDIREQLENEVEPAHLLEILDGLPGELNDLFKHILDRLDKYSRKRADQTLAMMSAITARHDLEDLSLNLLAYFFLNDYNNDPEFARGDKLEARLPLIRADVQKHRDDARKRLNGWCRGLVEADKDGNLAYAHRSVADFFKSVDVKEQMPVSVNGIHPVSILSELILAQMKVGGHDEPPPHWLLVKMRQECGLDHAPFSFLRCLDTVHATFWDKVDDPSFNGKIVTPVAIISSIRLAMKIMDTSNTNSLKQCPSLYFFPRLKSHEYVLWMIANDPTTTDTTSKAVLLFYVAVYAHQPTYPVIDMLLERGIITPATRTYFVPSGMWLAFKRRSITRDIDEGWSVWQNFLVKIFYEWLDNEEFDAENRFGGIAKRLLRHGADPRFRFATLVVQPSGKINENFVTIDYFYFGDPDRSEKVSFQHEREPSIFRGMNYEVAISKIRTWPYDPEGIFRGMSFRDLIQAMRSFESKEAVLQLVDDRMHELEKMDMDQSIPISKALEEPTPDKISVGETEKDARPYDTWTKFHKACSTSIRSGWFPYIVAALLVISAILAEVWRELRESEMGLPSEAS